MFPDLLEGLETTGTSRSLGTEIRDGHRGRSGACLGFHRHVMGNEDCLDAVGEVDEQNLLEPEEHDDLLVEVEVEVTVLHPTFCLCRDIS